MTSLSQSLVTDPALDPLADELVCADCQSSYVNDRVVYRPLKIADTIQWKIVLAQKISNQSAGKHCLSLVVNSRIAYVR